MKKGSKKKQLWDLAAAAQGGRAVRAAGQVWGKNGSRRKDQNCRKGEKAAEGWNCRKKENGWRRRETQVDNCLRNEKRGNEPNFDGLVRIK